MNQLNVFRWTFLAVGLLLALTVSAQAASGTTPNFQVTTFAGATATNDSLKGKPTLLMFWASWCTTCQKELPNLKALYDQKKEKGFQALAIGFQDKEANIRGYVQAHAGTFSFPTAYDVNDRVSEAFGVKGTPTFVLLDAQGKVVLVHVGGGFLDNPGFKKFIQEL
jgi:thiol-disulfide isomerase/thioredoxin